ncbi:MAG: NADPH:quinone oxidoreductase family protein [Usitatibacter sp.]
MKALMCTELGALEALAVQEFASLKAGPGQVVIDVKAAAANFPDVLMVEGKYQFKPPMPFAPGCELAGLVREVGGGVTHVKVGDPVIAIVMHGAFAEEALADAARVIPLPAGLDFETAASFMFTYSTSYHALKDRGHLMPGETLLVLGAAGGVGIAAVELGKKMGAKVIAAASTDEKLAACVSRGADATINYATEDLRERIKVLTEGRGADVIYDPVGGAYTEPALRGIAWRGRFLVVGFANGEIPRIPLNLALLKGCSIVGVFWGDFTRKEPEAHKANTRQLVEWVASGELRPLISGRFPLARGAEALRAVKDRKVTGKVLVLPEVAS